MNERKDLYAKQLNWVVDHPHAQYLLVGVCFPSDSELYGACERKT